MSQIPAQDVTTTDIARHVGVSQTTVSVVLRGKALKHRIAPQTAERVLAAARELRYVPNQVARNFRRRRSGMVGVVVSDFSMDWAEFVMRGMRTVFDNSEHTPFVATHGRDVERARKELLSCLQRRDDGVICQAVNVESDVYRKVLDAGVPLVFVSDRPLDVPEASFVGWDADTATRVAVNHLIEIGRRRIGMVAADDPTEMNQRRIAAYRETVENAGLSPRDNWVAIAPPDWPSQTLLPWSVDRLFGSDEDPPDAIFAINDAIALGLLALLAQRGIRVPEDVALIGMGDLQVTRFDGISLSTVGEPLEEMGKQAAEVMVELMTDPSRTPIHRLISGNELIVRRTTMV